MKRLLFAACACLLSSQLPLGAASSVVISEFMADNTRTLFDEDGDSEDWIEIHNVGSNAVNLLDWSLTDSPGNLRKWRFPATNLNVGAYMVIFASNNDRRTPGRPLHTNFRLDPDGEFLALVEPDGVTMASVFSPQYPVQVPNVSFGFGLVSSNTTLLAAGANARVLVPTAGNGGSTLGDAWKGGGEPFNDSGWRAGATGIGFSAAGAPSLVATSSMMVRLNFDAAPAGTVLADTKPIGAPINGANGAGAAGATWLASSTDQAVNPVARSGVLQFAAVENDQITLPANAAFNAARGTLSFWMRSFGFFGPAQGPAVIFDRETITGNLTTGGLIFQNPDGRLQFITYSNGMVAASATTASSPSDDRWHHIAVVYDQHPTTGFARIFMDGVQEVSVANTRGWTWPSAAQLEIGRSHEPAFRKYQGSLDDFRFYNASLDSAEVAEVAAGDGGVPASDAPTNLEAEMLNINSSAFIRIPFTVADPAAFSLLTLRVRHNDGFAAWLNGQLIATVNAPEMIQWDSTATAVHAGSLGDSATIGNPASVLRAGDNVLAIQGLNLSAGDPTFLVLPELAGTSVPVDSSAGLYFTQPTPGAANTGGTANTGPAITEVAHIPNVPIDSEDVRVTARVTPTFSLLGSVTLRYRIMYANEVSVPMNDRGTDGDLAAGDGLWSALIPASASTNGQMIRYLVTASDAQGVASKWPLFYSPTNSEQYLGTIVDPTNVISKLPIYHLFINPTDQAAADAENPGARCAIFYDGEFYDNVRIELRGNTSAGFRKKAHRIEFNRDHRFRHLDGYPRVGDTSFLGESADPAYMRQAFSFWLTDAMGVPSPFEYPVRLQNNGVFYQLALHSDVMGMEQLERLGYDPNGALYKAAGQIVPGFSSTGGFEKKTRLYEDRSDYLALANGINEARDLATRATNVFDMLDVPNVINYLTVARWTTEADDVWANMTIYRDSDGDQLWRIIPFDMNVSWGQLYCGDNAGAFNAIIATNDNFKSHPLYGGQTVLVNGGGNWNRIYDSIVRIPATREMLLRRMRSLLDQFVLPPGLTPLAYTMEKKFLSFSNSVYAESILDRLRWGWENPPTPNGPYCYGTNVWMTNHLTDIINQYVIPRRRHWYVTHSITNTARAIGIGNANNAGIPLTQPGNAVITVTRVEYNPSTGNQDEEYLCLTNGNPYAVDLSGWKLGGGVEFTFKGGTVMPSNSVLYVSPNTRVFRNRAAAPRGGMGLFAVGPYGGHLSARGEPLTITDNTGRLVYTNSFTGNPSGPQQFLRITEIMYNPPPLAGNTNDAQEFEFVELKNISASAAISLAGVRFVNGITFDFTGSAVTSLAPGARVLVVRNLAAFTARYGAANVAGQFAMALDNAGERLQLLDAANEEIHDFSYNNSWYPITDGAGYSLVVVDEAGDTGAWNRKEGWRPNGTMSGAPGQPDPVAPSFANIVVNEVLAHTSLPQVDAIELLNPTGGGVNVGGWFLSDDFDVPRKYRIPDGTLIPAGGQLSFDASLFNNPATALVPFALSSRGDDVWVFSGDASTNLSGYVVSEDFGASANGVSLGRYTNSVGRVHFVAQTANTLGAPNAGPRVGPVVISEIMYHPPDYPDGTDNSADEYIELRNITGAAVPLFNTNAPALAWRLRESVEFDFPAGVTLPADGLLLMVSFNTLEERQLAAFRARYDVPAGVPVYGPYRGQLDNSSGDLRLERPDNPEGGEVPYIRVDRVEYQDTAPWPAEADGNVPSLQRLNASAYGNDPTNWVAVAPSAGRPHLPGGTPPSITAQPVDTTAIVGRSASLSVAVSGTAPFFYQWRFNNVNVYGANGPVLSIPLVQPDHAGIYNVVIFNSAGSAQSADARLSLLLPPSVVLQPTNRNVIIAPDPRAARVPVVIGGVTTLVPMTNITFTTAGSSVNSAVSYQWRFNDVDLPGATGASITITNVQLEDEGSYSCLISDTVDTVETAGALLTPWIAPTYVQPPLGQSIAAGSDFSASVEINGHPPPFGFSWRRGSIVIGSNYSTLRSDFFTANSTAAGLILTNNILSSNYTMRLIVYNAANNSPGVLVSYTNTVVADVDRDGIPDVVEEGLGLSANNPADAALDLDGDGMSNHDEYIAGTNPADNLSYLKIDSIAAGGGATLTFGAASNKTYSVEYSDALGAGPWLRLINIVARPSNRVETVADAGFTTNRAYRLVTPPQ